MRVYRFSNPPHGNHAVMKIESLDHVALWVADRDGLANFACDYLGMHVIERTDVFTIVGADARRGKLTLFADDRPRDPGPLVRVTLRVAGLDQALAKLPAGLEIERPQPGLATFTGPQRLGIGLIESSGPEYDFDHVVLCVRDREQALWSMAGLGFERDGGSLRAGSEGARVELESGDGSFTGERSLLNHLGLLVKSAEEHLQEAKRSGLEIADVVDAANTYAVFIWGPDRIKLEYVEHKPSFSLA
jgi:catechol 2,3-dioxygenase-like lactoylglutathione lyase family enzyme